MFTTSILCQVYSFCLAPRKLIESKLHGKVSTFQRLWESRNHFCNMLIELLYCTEIQDQTIRLPTRNFCMQPDSRPKRLSGHTQQTHQIQDKDMPGHTQHYSAHFEYAGVHSPPAFRTPSALPEVHFIGSCHMSSDRRNKTHLVGSVTQNQALSYPM